MLLDPNRMGRVSMKPQLAKRFINCDSYRATSEYRFGRFVDAISCYGDQRKQTPCAWCERDKWCYTYLSNDYGQDEGLIHCCCWACFHQWLAYREKVTIELDWWFVLGVRPEYIPTWYLPPEVMESLAAAARVRLGL